YCALVYFSLYCVSRTTSPLYSPSFLFLTCLPHPRAPPSFPTRRSSDLGVSVTLHPIRNLDLFILPARRRIVEALRVFIILFSFQDRKSTRLNSSHVEISYAVFCLKKKK